MATKATTQATVKAMVEASDGSEAEVVDEGIEDDEDPEEEDVMVSQI